MRAHFILILLVAFMAAWFWWRLPPAPSTMPSATPEADIAPAVGEEPDDETAGEGGLIAYHPMADVLGDPATAPEKEAAILYDLMQSYRRMNGEYPVAEDNAGVMRQLRGQNPQRLRLFPEQHARYNRRGELLDAWGTPFFFHHLSSQHIEIRSAGPDRVFHTADDLLEPPPRFGVST